MNSNMQRVQEAVFNADRRSLGLLSFEIDLSGISSRLFVIYCPSYETRLDMIAFDLSYVIYCRNFDAPNADKFRGFIKTDSRGQQLFSAARELAKQSIPKLPHNMLLRPPPMRDILILYIMLITLIAVFICCVYLK